MGDRQHPLTGSGLGYVWDAIVLGIGAYAIAPPLWVLGNEMLRLADRSWSPSFGLQRP